MLGLDMRAAKAAWTVFLLALLLLTLYYVRGVLFVFIVAILFAYLLHPIVNLVNRFLPWPRSRTWSLAIVYVVLTGLLILAGTLIGTRIVEQANNLVARLPEIQDSLIKRLQEPGPAWLQPIQEYLLKQVSEGFQSFTAMILPELKRAGAQAIALLSSVVLAVLVPILGFFFLKDGGALRDRFLAVLSPERRPLWTDIAADVSAVLGQFIRALVILSLATFAIYALFFGIIGLPFAILLAAIAGLLEFVPVFGPLTAAVAILLVAGLSGFGHVVLILIFLGAYRLFQDYVLTPHLMSHGIALHPVLVIFGVLAGEQIGGVQGMFLSIPALAVLRVIYLQVTKARAAAEPLPR